MRKTITIAALVAASLGYGAGEDVTKGRGFEVASITPCKPGTPEPPGEHMGMVQFVYPGGMFRANATTLKFLLEWAYGIQPSQHTGGPSWMETDRYDIVAKAEGNATDAEMRLMMQRLLAERFKLKLHRESKETPVYVIGLGKTAPKLLPPKPEETRALRVVPQTGPDQKVTSYHVIATRYSLQQLTDVFARQIGRVIVNQTGLEGDFDFTLDLTPDENRPSPLEPTLLMTAMREQLGLTLRSEKTHVDVLVIDSAEKVAAGN
jgi:uncharacterized protein (TIGR03435 family)